jgi:hypothetical protein
VLYVSQRRKGFQVVIGLHDQPRRRIATEVLGQSRRRIDCDAAALFDDFVDAGGD